MICSSVQYCAALNIAEELDLDKDKYTMHQDDNIGKSAIRELVRSKHEKIINPFSAGLDLLKKLRNQARHFSTVHTSRAQYQVFE